MEPKQARKLVRSILAPGKEPDPDLVAEVAVRLRPLQHQSQWEAARHVLSHGQVPTDELVDAEVRRRRDRRDKAIAVARNHAELGAQRAVDFVTAYRTEHQVGPTWFELTRHMGWPHATQGVSIRHLARLGYLVCTPENRSLDVVTAEPAKSTGGLIPAE